MMNQVILESHDPQTNTIYQISNNSLNQDKKKQKPNKISNRSEVLQ